MSRFNAQVVLIDRILEQSEDGGFREAERVESPRFANIRRMGDSTWFAARSAGLHADAQVELRSVDYDGQDLVVLEGVEYEVERALTYGEMVSLTLRRGAANE